MTGPRSVLVENGAGKIRARRNLFHSVKYLNEESKFRLGGGEGGSWDTLRQPDVRVNSVIGEVYWEGRREG